MTSRALIMTLLLAVATHQSSQTNVLQLQDVIKVMQKVTEPFVITRRFTENVTSMASENLLSRLAKIPGLIGESHGKLTKAVEASVQTAKAAEVMMRKVAKGVKGIDDRFSLLLNTCPKHRFYVDQTVQSNAHGAEELNNSPFSHHIGELPSVSDKYDHNGMNMDKKLREETRTKTPQLVGTAGYEIIEAALLAEYGPDARIKLSDVVTAVKMTGQAVERSRMENLKHRIEKSATATDHIINAYAEARKLRAVTGHLETLAKMIGVQRSTSSVDNLKKFIDTVLGSLDAVQCEA